MLNEALFRDWSKEGDMKQYASVRSNTSPRDWKQIQWTDTTFPFLMVQQFLLVATGFKGQTRPEFV